MVRMAGVGPEWSHSMAHALALDARTWSREDVPGLGLIDEDVDLLKGCAGPASGRRDATSGIRADPCGFTGTCGRSCAGMVRMAGMGPEWSHSMAHALALDARTWPRGDVPGLLLIDEDVDLLRG
ncbi:hypothetical protein EJB05_53516, partial [Eragrostis curvula]